MAIGRITKTAKFDALNDQFMSDLASRLLPFEVSESSLINTCITIVRLMDGSGEIDLSPESLQRFLRNLGNTGFLRNLGNERKGGKV